jgi:hypothetical protein
LREKPRCQIEVMPLNQHRHHLHHMPGATHLERNSRRLLLLDGE